MAPEVPKTVDNLPIETHQQWAKNQESLAQGPKLREDRYIPALAQIDVTAPEAYPSALTSVIGEDRANVLWAAIEAPEVYTRRTSNVFTPDGLIPSLGNLEEIKKKLESTPETFHGK